MWTMIRALEKESALPCTHIVNDLNSQSPKKGIGRECKDMQNRLRKLSEDRAAGRRTIPELLRGVGYNIR